jgi:mRNA interferase MazF
MQSSATRDFPRRGEIWLITINPSVPKDPHLPRPVVIMSTNTRNRSWDSVIVVPCSTGLQNANENFHIPIPAGQGGLERETRARCDLVSNLEKINLDSEKGPLGHLSEKHMWEIVRGIRACVGDKE